jgi:TolB protein
MGCGKYFIYIRNTDGIGGTTAVTNGYAGNTNGNSYAPDWSPDGTQLLFSYITSDVPATTGFGIWSVKTGGTTILAATTEHCAGASCNIPGGGRFLSDGSILYASARSGHPQIWKLSAGHVTLTNLSNNAHREFDPFPSPDGTKIAFASNRNNGVSTIYTMNLQGKNVTHVNFPPIAT